MEITDEMVRAACAVFEADNPWHYMEPEVVRRALDAAINGRSPAMTADNQKLKEAIALVVTALERLITRGYDETEQEAAARTLIKRALMDDPDAR